MPGNTQICLCRHAVCTTRMYVHMLLVPTSFVLCICLYICDAVKTAPLWRPVSEHLFIVHFCHTHMYMCAATLLCQGTSATRSPPTSLTWLRSTHSLTISTTLLYKTSLSATPLCTPSHMSHLCYKTTSLQRPVPQPPYSVFHHTWATSATRPPLYRNHSLNLPLVYSTTNEAPLLQALQRPVLQLIQTYLLRFRRTYILQWW